MKKLLFVLFVLMVAMACNPLAVLDSIIRSADNYVDGTCTEGCYNVLDGGPKVSPRPVQSHYAQSGTVDYRSEACRTYPLFKHQKESDVTEAQDGEYCGTVYGSAIVTESASGSTTAKNDTPAIAATVIVTTPAVTPTPSNDECPSGCVEPTKVREGEYNPPPTGEPTAKPPSDNPVPVCTPTPHPDKP